MGEKKEKSVQLCKKKKVLEAINVLKQLNKKFLENEAQKQPLLAEATDCPVFLQVTMKKIPPKRMGKRIKVLLPHSLVTDTSEVCLFTGDMDKRNKKAEIEPDVLHYKELLKKQGITNVSEVITLRQLRTEYKVYEAKRQLMAAYDVFLSDKTIAQCLPKLLGKVFIKKRKFPIQVNMKTSNLKSQIDKALSETVFLVNCRGNSCTSEVARMGMDDSKILENIMASVKILADEIPGEQNNIFGIYLKTAKSQAIPIFISFGNPNEVKLLKSKSYEKLALEELSTLPNTQVKVFKDGRIVVKNMQVDSDDESSTNTVNPLNSHPLKREREDSETSEDNLAEEKETCQDTEQDSSPDKPKKKRKTVKNEKSDSDKEMQLKSKSEGAEVDSYSIKTRSNKVIKKSSPAVKSTRKGAGIKKLSTKVKS